LEQVRAAFGESLLLPAVFIAAAHLLRTPLHYVASFSE
jgi:hypothetical protein